MARLPSPREGVADDEVAIRGLRDPVEEESTLSLQQRRRLVTPRGVSLLLSGACGAVLALVGVVVYDAVANEQTIRQGRSEPEIALAGQSGSLTFTSRKADEVLGELSSGEIRSVADFLARKKGVSPDRNGSSVSTWLSGPSAIELLRPRKQEVLAYLDTNGPRPKRFARATVVAPGTVMEYRVGPLEGGTIVENAVFEPLTTAGDIPYQKRPMESLPDHNLASNLLTEPIFPELPGFTGEKGATTSWLRNNMLTGAGKRSNFVMFFWVPPKPARPEANWLHPLPFKMTLDTTAVNPEEWQVTAVEFCSQGPFASAKDLMTAYKNGKVRVCPFHPTTGAWDVPQHVDKAGVAAKTDKHSVNWGPWSFTVTQRPSTGLAFLDLQFKGERVLYELSLQDAMAAYSGDDASQFLYSDAAFSLSMLSASLKPGVDCPDHATLMNAPNWFVLTGAGGDVVADETKAADFWPVCVFEWKEDHTLWRHMQNADGDVRGLARRTVVVRSVATVGNYDYIMDVKFREDGEINVYTRFAGYIESRYFDEAFNPHERAFSTILAPHLAGPVHSHIVCWKADFDIAGQRSNTMRVTSVKAKEFPVTSKDGNEVSSLMSKYIETRVIEKEGINASTFVAHPEHPGIWNFVDRNSTSPSGNPRGYAVTLGSFATTQVLPGSHPFVRAMPYTKYHLAVTKYHDDEYRVTQPYILYDGLEAVKSGQDLEAFLADGEDLLDTDLVAWISLGKEHITRQEDLPLVSNFGVEFSLQPWNFFSRNVAASPLQ
eukprot:TRINITY_DN17638_c0_g1_i1.p1 TRINITY_DN17638_c0_g1~~TRINITY_DN17638_c0_g1_i1.p1  ORF type:complete len:772 (+),score=130.73 TRINITY_DN17638_c0_g1_i1:73-2388(+)